VPTGNDLLRVPVG